MALFKKKETETAGDTPPASKDWQPDPRKARKFFEHARTTHDSTNYEYAMQLWLGGLKFDPSNMDALDGFFKSATRFTNESKKGPSSSVTKALQDKAPTTKYALALLDHATKPLDSAKAIKAFETAVKMDLPEPAYELGERAMAVVSRDKKTRKDTWVKLMELFEDLGVYDKATKCGELAIELDPADGPLATRVRNMSAEATMSSGGFSETNKVGGFAKNVRDLKAQQQFDAEDRIAKDSSTQERLIESAKEDYEKRPNDIAAAEQYIRRLLDRGNESDEKTAFKVAQDALAATGKTSFKVTAGDIRLRVFRRTVSKYKDAADAAPNDQDKARTLLQAKTKLAQEELKEFAWRVEEFPSDNSYKLELARRMVALGPLKNEYFEQAIPLLQKAKVEVKLRPRSLRLLADAFSAIGYLGEAIDSMREALSIHPDKTDQQGLDMQYGLMLLLKRHAEESRDPSPAREADTIASKIMQHDFGYRDVKQQRDDIKGLLQTLS